MGPQNYVELPQDEHGNRLYTNSQPLVIRAEKIGTVLRVLEPLNFRLSWPAVKAAGWKEVDHEAGAVTIEEWREMVGL